MFESGKSKDGCPSKLTSLSYQRPGLPEETFISTDGNLTDNESLCSVSN